MTSRSVARILVTTSEPTTMQGSLVVLLDDQHQTNVVSSSRVYSGSETNAPPVGIDTLSIHTPYDCSNLHTPIAIAYGATSKKPNDSHAMLFMLPSQSISGGENNYNNNHPKPNLLWKCRVPETLTGGLVMTNPYPFTVGGGKSGNLYVWNRQGHLLRTIASHYRSIHVLRFHDPFLFTGGADGMIHVYNILDLVQESSSSSSKEPNVQPIRTFTHHHLAVTDIIPIQGQHRMSSASQDGQIVIWETFSKTMLSSFPFSRAITCLAYSNYPRIYAGSASGTIHVIDLDEYAWYKSHQMWGATQNEQNQTQQKHPSGKDRTGGEDDDLTDGGKNTTIQQSVFGFTTGQEKHQASFQPRDLSGHDRPVTALHVFYHQPSNTNDSYDSNETEFLISGDEAGFLRVWDVQSFRCIRIIHPWKNTATTSTTALAAMDSQPKTISLLRHPITSIQTILAVPDVNITNSSSLTTTAFVSTRRHHKKHAISTSYATLFGPLQKFAITESRVVPVPNLHAYRDARSIAFWSHLGDSNDAQWQRLLLFSKKKRKTSNQSTKIAPTAVSSDVQESGLESSQPLHSDITTTTATNNQELVRLQQELAEAKATILRWEDVNNKLMKKLQQQKQPTQP